MPEETGNDVRPNQTPPAGAASRRNVPAGWRAGAIAGWLCAAVLGFALFQAQGRVRMLHAALAAATPDMQMVKKAPKGPTFSEFHAKLEKEGGNLTQAQLTSYFESVMGTTVRWQGKVVDVSGGPFASMSLMCAPGARWKDLEVELNPDAQHADLLKIRKGQSVVVEGVLTGYWGRAASYELRPDGGSSGSFGPVDEPADGTARYEIRQARIVKS